MSLAVFVAAFLATLVWSLWPQRRKESEAEKLHKLVVEDMKRREPAPVEPSRQPAPVEPSRLVPAVIQKSNAFTFDLAPHERKIERLEGDVKHYQEAIRRLRAYVNAAADPAPQGSAELLRRSYHAIRELHNYRLCRLKGCEYCALGNDIHGAVGTQKLVEQTTIAKRVLGPEESTRGITAYLGRANAYGDPRK
jgi:hypothetical protein